jgi:thioredoxin-like negative regulator of GroEL
MPAWQQIAAWRAASQAPPASKTPVPPSLRAPTPSMAPPPVELLDDSGKLRRAEQLVERRAFADASRILAELGKKNPKDAQVASLQAWSLYHQWSSERPSQELVESIERALRVEPEHVRALYVKALVLRKMGRENDALRMFQRVLRADPAHLDAMRELRLAKMRRGK